MAATTRPGTFEGGVEPQATAWLKKRHGICLPSRLIEVDRQEEAGLVEQKRVDAGNERLSRVVSALQVPPDDVIGHRNEATIRAERAFDTRLLANPAHPLVRARRCVARSTGSTALESACVDILTTAEQRTEERDLGRRRRMPVNGGSRETHGQSARLTRTFVGVADTRQPSHVSTASVRKSIEIRSTSACRPGCGSRRSRSP